MTFPYQLENQQFPIQAESVEKIPGGLILHAAQPHVNLPEHPRSFYRHGWQTWSLTTWQDPKAVLPVPKPDRLHPMQTDPVYVNHPAPNGSWVGAVEIEDGKVILLGALGLEAHVALHNQDLHGWYEEEGGDWFLGFGDESEVFARYASLLGARLGESTRKETPCVWCSWYSLYTAIDEPVLHQIFEELDDLPFDVLQVDDGWQQSIGDWEANRKFPSGMRDLADRIKSTGRRAGLWLAPLIAAGSSRLFRDHPDWFLREAQGGFASAGFNWGESLYALDTTHPKALEWLAALMQQVRAWGFEYLKLDFLYGGALPGIRHRDTPRETAYRQGLQTIRNALGEETYLLTCGAPILPSLGLCQALRVGPDVAGDWESRRDARLLYNPSTPGVKNAIRTTVNRYWLEPLVALDPDVVYFTAQQNSLTKQQKQLLQDLSLACRFKATSDPPQYLSRPDREELRTFLEMDPAVQRLSRHRFRLDAREIDFNPAMALPDPPRGLDGLARGMLGWVGNQRWALRLLYRLHKRSTEEVKGQLVNA